MIRQLVGPLAVAVVTFHAGEVLAQGAFPAPLPQAGPSSDCMKDFLPSRQEAEKRGQALKVAGEKHADPDVACKLIGNFIQAEVKMIKYAETNSGRCGIPPQISEQLRKGHQSSEAMQARVCDAAQRMKNRAPVGPTLSDVLSASEVLKREPVGPVGDFWPRH